MSGGNDRVETLPVECGLLLAQCSHPFRLLFAATVRYGAEESCGGPSGNSSGLVARFIHRAAGHKSIAHLISRHRATRNQRLKLFIPRASTERLTSSSQQFKQAYTLPTCSIFIDGCIPRYAYNKRAIIQNKKHNTASWTFSMFHAGQSAKQSRFTCFQLPFIRILPPPTM